MLFHEKLYKLRKERNLSQEALAESLCTTRQAVSKWETGKGFPETEKLLQMANLFEVSVDYLLKDTDEDGAAEQEGYYVSKEMAEGYLAHQKRWAGRFSLGAAVMILSVTPFLKFQRQGGSPLVFLLMAVTGGILALRAIVSADKKYDVLSREPLLFDSAYLKALRAAAGGAGKRCAQAFAVSFAVFMAAVLFTRAAGKGAIPLAFGTDVPAAMQIAVLVLAVSAAVLFYTGTMAESYALLTQNEEHTKGFAFRLRRKLKKKLDDWLK